MTELEQKRYRHLIARQERVKHGSIEVCSCEGSVNGQRIVVTKIRGFKYAYIFNGDIIERSWRCV